MPCKQQSDILTCGLIENYGVPEESRKPQRALNGRIYAGGVDGFGPYFANYVT